MTNCYLCKEKLCLGGHKEKEVCQVCIGKYGRKLKLAIEEKSNNPINWKLRI